MGERRLAGLPRTLPACRNGSVRSVMIPRSIATAFPPDVQSRGDKYFKSGHVRLVRASAVELTAMVAGTTGYIVRFAAATGMITATCTCPYAFDNGICKHIWATLRFAEAQGNLAPLLGTAGKKPRLVALTAEESDDFDDDDYGEDDEEDYESDEDLALFETEWRARPAPTSSSRAKPTRNKPAQPAPKPRPPEWKTLLDGARQTMQYQGFETTPAEWPADRRVVYLIDLVASRQATGLVVELSTERLGKDGTWGPPVQFQLPVEAWFASPAPRARHLAHMLMGAPARNPYVYVGRRPGPFVLDGPAIPTTLPLLCETGRCRVRRVPGERPVESVGFDSGAPWTLHVRVTRAAKRGLLADAVLRRADEEMSLSEPEILHSAGVLLARGSLARLEHGGAFPFISVFRATPEVGVNEQDLPSFLESFYSLPRRPAIALPEGATVAEVRQQPRPGVVIHSDPTPWRETHHRLEVFFVYGSRRLTARDENGAAPSIFDRETLTVHHRDPAAEAAAIAHLYELGAKEEWSYTTRTQVLTVHRNKLGRMVADLTGAGWRVEANGVAFRVAGDLRASVRSGIDWFELSAS